MEDLHTALELWRLIWETLKIFYEVLLLAQNLLEVLLNSFWGQSVSMLSFEGESGRILTVIGPCETSPNRI